MCSWIINKGEGIEYMEQEPFDKYYVFFGRNIHIFYKLRRLYTICRRIGTPDRVQGKKGSMYFEIQLMIDKSQKGLHKQWKLNVPATFCKNYRIY